MSDTVNSRNITALHEALKRERARTDELVGKQEHLARQVAMQSTEIATLRNQVVMVLASRGTGPTQRND
jgi:hypothetical protein